MTFACHDAGIGLTRKCYASLLFVEVPDTQRDEKGDRNKGAGLAFLLLKQAKAKNTKKEHELQDGRLGGFLLRVISWGFICTPFWDESARLSQPIAFPIAT